MLSKAALNSFDKIGIPEHRLCLKVGDICFIIRNMHINDGICNSARCQILRIEQHVIFCKLLDGSNQMIELCRIRFVFRLPFGHSFQMCREQFPLRRAYAMTFNRSEGQTLKRVVLDLRSELFAHGFLYVGLSRVTDVGNLFLFAPPNKLYYCQGDQVDNYHRYFNGGVVVSNVVYGDCLNRFAE